MMRYLVMFLVLIGLVVCARNCEAKPIMQQLHYHKNPYREYLDNPKQVTIKMIDHTAKSMVVLCDKLDDMDIDRALFDALDRHVDVGIVINKSGYLRSKVVIDALVEDGADLWLDLAVIPKSIMIFDGFAVINGVELLHNYTIADVYMNEWAKHARNSQQVKRR
jgi:hypothetical protein